MRSQSASGPSVRVNCVSPGWIDVSGWQKASRRRPARLSRGGPRPASGRPRRDARGRRGAGRVSARRRGEVRHRPELRLRRRDDPQDDLPVTMPADRRVVYAAGFLRATSNGLIGVVAGIYLARLGFAPAAFGVILAAGIAGTAVAAAIVTFWGDRIGRKRGLILLALASAAGRSGDRGRVGFRRARRSRVPRDDEFARQGSRGGRGVRAGDPARVRWTTPAARASSPGTT